ncbi:DUF4192 family protein [Microbacterium aureliae]
MTTIVKAANAAQFLAIVPRLLGCHVTRSVVLVPFEGKRTCGGMRFDLPHADDEVDRLAATFIGMVCKLPDVDRVAIVVYTDEAFDGHGIPRESLVEALRIRADACGLAIVDALCVGPDAWGSYLDPDPAARRRPLDEVADGAPPLLEGMPEPAAHQSAGVELPTVDQARAEQVGRALTDLEHAVAVLCGPAPGCDAGSAASPDAAVADDDRVDPRALAAACTLDDLPDLFERALRWSPEDLTPYEAATMIWCLTRPALRDIATVDWCGGIAAGDEALDAQLRWEQGEEYPAHLAMHMWGEGDRPDVGRLKKALALTRMLAALSPREHRPGILATCAWLSWALGRSTHAGHYASSACEIEPEHGLAEIVLSFVAAGHLPEWAFARPGGEVT